MDPPMPLENAATQVFAIPELLEMILLNFNQNETHSSGVLALHDGITPLFALQRINTTFLHTIADSTLLQHRLFHPSPAPPSITSFCAPIQRAWEKAKQSPESSIQQSWRRIRLTPGVASLQIEVPKEVLEGTYLEGHERSYMATFDFGDGTTLGMLWDWYYMLEKRTPEEHLEEWRKQNPRGEEFAMSIRTSAFSLLY